MTVDVNGTLASNIQYRLKLTVDDGSGAAPWAQTFRTLKAPANPEPARQVHHRDPGRRRARHGPPHRPGERRRGPDQRRLHRRLDPEPLRLGLHRGAQAPPVGARRHRREGAQHAPASGARSPRTATPSTASCVAGQTHWLAGGAGWSDESAIGQQGGKWEKHWSLYYYENITADRVTGGDLAAGSVQNHFLTKGLTDFHVVGPGSGAVELRDYAQGHVLAEAQARRRAVLPGLRRPVPDRRAPDQRRPGRRPRLPALVERRLERRVRPGRRARAAR